MNKARGDERAMAMKWKDLSGEERYRVVELVQAGKVEIRELCKTFGVSRQTLYRAIEAVEKAAMAALEPKKPGRRPKPQSEVKTEHLVGEKSRLEKELAQMKTRYEVTRTILDLERKLDRGQPLPGEKNKKNKS
ncbi:helix-turn-helix domain-containing protein [Thermodesulfobacteriota bacterium]